MLTITTDALEAIRAIEDDSGTQGVRISASPHSLNGSGPALRIEPAPGPEAGDEVVEAEGAQVFIAPSAAALGDKVLDAEVDADEVRFMVREPDELD